MQETLTCGCVYDGGTLISPCSTHANARSRVIDIHDLGSGAHGIYEQQIQKLQTRIAELEKSLAINAAAYKKSVAREVELEAFSAKAREQLQGWLDCPWANEHMERIGLDKDTRELLSSSPTLPDLEAADELVDNWMKLSTREKQQIWPHNQGNMENAARRWIASRGKEK